MKYENERKIIEGMNKIFNAEAEDLVQKNTALQEEVGPLKKQVQDMTKEMKNLRGYKDMYDRTMLMITELVKDGVIKDTSGDQGEMTEYGPQGDWRIQYEYKDTKYDIASGSL